MGRAHPPKTNETNETKTAAKPATPAFFIAFSPISFLFSIA
jgi:hypothetical protein